MQGLYELLPAKLSTGLLTRSAHVSFKVTSEVKPFSLFNLICVLIKAMKGTISARCEKLLSETIGRVSLLTLISQLVVTNANGLRWINEMLIWCTGANKVSL